MNNLYSHGEPLPPRPGKTVFTVLCLLVVSSFCQLTRAQTDLDALSKQASDLEANLGKYNDATPEAADIMVELTNLYHEDARLFGLVRVGNRFISTHPKDPRHKAVMLQTIDGLQALSRNTDMIVACRQFLTQYSGAPECADIEQRLANTLSRGKDKKATAAAYHAIWRRMGNTPGGRTAAARAIRNYNLSGNKYVATAAQLAEDLMDANRERLAVHVGRYSVDAWSRSGNYAESNRAATKLLRYPALREPEQRRLIFMQMADNYKRLGQYNSSAKSYSEARKLRDDQAAHSMQLDQLNTGKAAAREIEPIARDYAAKYTDREDRYRGLMILVQAHLRENNSNAAQTLLRDILVHDAKTNNAAQLFVETNGNEPKQLADTERVLRDALNKNSRHAAYIRYTLAFPLYRDRLKDPEKTRGILRELIERSPTSDGYSKAAISWLLDNAKDENEFRGDLNRILLARKNHPEIPAFTKHLTDWRQSAKRDLKRRGRAKLVDSALEEADRDPVTQLAAKQNFNYSKQESQIRDALLADNIIGKLGKDFVNELLKTQGYYYRRYVSNNLRKASADYYGKLAKRLPTDFEAAQLWLESATDYATPEVVAEAAQHLITLPPQQASGDIYRRLMIAAEKNKDPELGVKALNWITASQRKTKADATYASYIGDLLARLELSGEAINYWATHVQTDPNSTESRECATRLLQTMAPSEKRSFIESLLKQDTPFQGRYSTWLADMYLKEGNLDKFAGVLQASKTSYESNPLSAWDLDLGLVSGWVTTSRSNTDASESDRARIYTIVRELDYGTPSAIAALAHLEIQPSKASKMETVLAHQRTTQPIDNDSGAWDAIFPYSQAALTRRDYLNAATLASGMLSNLPQTDDRRLKSVRDIVTQCYARLGSVGLTIDEDSPIAPLLQAALYLRLGDETLAYTTYDENRSLFNEHRDQLPVDLITFICGQRMAAGGDENHDFVEDVLRGWLVANSESPQVDDESKAAIQLQLATNYYKGSRYDVARSEFTTTINRYSETPQATEAKFGIGESFMAQKVYDQAELVFEELARNPEMDIVVRAEFLRGVLAFRRGDADDARDIFRSVLERVPNVELANQALFNLSEVYGSEERYIDQLNLLRTVGRLGRRSTRLHAPGLPLSIVVHDSDLGISRGHNKIPVIVTTHPGGDSEKIMLTSAGAGRGLFRADVETQLGDAQANDNVLQLIGEDTIQCDYPDEFKAEFKRVPLSDVDIKIASNAKFEASSSKIVDQQQETFSQRMAREEAEESEDSDLRISQQRPANQIKPGNEIYLRVIDQDRDLSAKRDTIPIKMVADSGDNLQVMLSETEPHSGVFEGTAATAELPAGALASDTAINHSPLMAIDLDEKTYWLAEPDGAAPKNLTVDMKDLREVSRVRMSTPDETTSAPVSTELRGSHDGEFWFRIGGVPELEVAAPVATEYAQMQQRVYKGKHYGITQWYQVADLGMNRSADETALVDSLQWSQEEESSKQKTPYGVIWSGKFVQHRSGALRIAVKGYTTGLAVGSVMHLPVAKGNQSVDLWLDQGIHDLSIFAATDSSSKGVEATIARATLKTGQLRLAPFTVDDFDLSTAPDVTPSDAPPAPQPLVLSAADATLTKISDDFGSGMANERPQLNNWKNEKDIASWSVNFPQSGAYEVWIQCAHAGTGSQAELQLAARTLQFDIPDTKSWQEYQDTFVGKVIIPKPGKVNLTLSPVSIGAGNLMNLQNVTFKAATDSTTIVNGPQWDFRFPTQELRYVRFVFNEFLGESVAVNNVEIGGPTSEQTYIPTSQDVLALATNDALEIAAGDTVTANYTDEFTQNSSATSQLLNARLTATYNDAAITPITYAFTRNAGGQVQETRLNLMRVDAGDRMIVEITDYDEDATAELDEIEFEVFVNDAEPLRLKATETDPYSGIFTKEVDTTANEEEGKLTVAPGDRIYIRYLDLQNTFPGHSVPRESVVYVSKPTDAKLSILQTRTVPRKEGDLRAARIKVTDPPAGPDDSLVSLNAPLTIEVIDPDRAKNSASTVKVAVLTTGGSALIVECGISNAYHTGTRRNTQDALEQGRFLGQVIMQLGGDGSPELVPRTVSMPRNLIGEVQPIDPDAEEIFSDMVIRVLNLTGKDSITAAYNDKQRLDSKAQRLTDTARLVSDGTLSITDREYINPVESLHVGEKIYFSVNDADQDTSDDRDSLTLQVTTAFGESESVELYETLTHSGIFTGSFLLKASQEPVVGNLDPQIPAIECYFGDTITARYSDQSAASQLETLEVTQEVPVVIGTDGLVTAFTKTFNDETLAVETKFRIAESYFELFKSHKQLDRTEEQETDLQAGRRVLREVMEDYPDPKYAPRISYLLGQFAQELEDWDEAIRSYELIIRRFPDHTLAADARYKLAQSYEEAGEFDDALEAYVTLAATHPKSPLIASVMIRISDYFYRNEDFEVAAQVGEKFGQRFEGHDHASKMAFRVGQCYYKTEDYKLAGFSFDEFAKRFPEDELSADSLFWSGEAYRLANNNREAFRRYNRCRWDYPESEAAKYARGRLALPEMLQQFEAEASSIDNE